jgi:CDP-2,3-bis-(O-geranylgeranyl)-sn-glycerol synthase
MTLKFIISCVYFYLPAAFANMGAVLSRFVPIFNRLNLPIDMGQKIGGQRIIGDHKTFGGYLFGVLFGTFAGLIKYALVDNYFREYLLFDLNLPTTLFLYFIMANGALLGDLIKSILKRIFNIPPHSAWTPFDQIDHSTLSMLLASLIVPINIQTYITVVIIYFFLHLISNVVAFLLKLKKVPY